MRVHGHSQARREERERVGGRRERVRRGRCEESESGGERIKVIGVGERRS